MPREKYNALWPDSLDDLAIELKAIEYGGKWKSKSGKECGEGLYHHFVSARRLIWPHRYFHRWSKLMYEEFLHNDITILLGAASTQKTSHASEFVLLNYWARPHKTLVILSTITMDKLDTGVFGEVKMLWQAGRDLHPWLPGNLIENRRAIVTDNLSILKSRDMRKGIIGRPCYVSGKWVGLGVLAGTKQEYIFYLCDEIQFMAESFIGSWPNLFANGNVKIIGSGNPKHDPDDQAGIAAEPKEGWQSVAENDKTAVWDTQFLNGRCVNLVGTDSPNFDVPDGAPEPYAKLIGRKFAKRIAHDWGENSPQYYSQVKGIMRIDMADQRVITRMLCRQHHAQDTVTWSISPRTKIYGLDPSYGGGDQCIAVVAEFGEADSGLLTLSIIAVREIVIDMSRDMSPEEQVSLKVFGHLKEFSIPTENAFYDPYGKGTMGFAFARQFPGQSPIPVDSGAKPTERPVREDLWVFDDKTGTRRLKTCAEHYSKFVTEAWFSTRYLIEAEQLRGLPSDVMLEGCGRRYGIVAGNKIEVESKDDYKERLKHSPNKYDAFAVCVEGARQRGFTIARLGVEVGSDEADSWFEKEAEEYQQAIRSRLLIHH